MEFIDYLLIIYLASIVLMSLIALIAFCKDKKKAVKGEMRTKEKTLLFLAIMNGAFGAFIGRKVAHHKTDKVYFSITIYFGMLMQVLALGAILLAEFVF